MGSLTLHHLSRGHAQCLLNVHFAENVNASILWITGNSQTTLGINLGLFYIQHRGEIKKEKEKMGHHNLDIVQLKERSQVPQSSPANKLLKDRRAGRINSPFWDFKSSVVQSFTQWEMVLAVSCKHLDEGTTIHKTADFS